MANEDPLTLDDTPLIPDEDLATPEIAAVDEEPPPDNPLDHPVLPDPTPQPENYHVSIWETPETFVCLRCAAKGLTYAEVAYHLDAAHDEDPVPTPLAAQYTPPQTPPASGEEALLLMGTRRVAVEERPQEDMSAEDVPEPVPQEEAV